MNDSSRLQAIRDYKDSHVWQEKMDFMQASYSFRKCLGMQVWEREQTQL